MFLQILLSKPAAVADNNPDAPFATQVLLLKQVVTSPQSLPSKATAVANLFK